jgi:3-dehydroquinate dehydratase I
VKTPEICVAITGTDLKDVKLMEPLVDLYELRIDLIGKDWRDVAKELKKPWIACNRPASQGGKWKGSEEKRIKELTDALALGSRIVDIDLGSPGIDQLVPLFKNRAEVLISHHDFKETPSLDRMRQIVVNELAAGADICKVVTTARSFKDNLVALHLISLFPATKIVSFCMGELGWFSRAMCPVGGGCFTYAAVGEGKESAKGQISAAELNELYGILVEKR